MSDAELILVAIFDGDSSLGLVQLFFQELTARVARLPKQSGGSQPTISRELNEVLDLADREARELKDEYISTEHILLALLQADGPAARLLAAAGLSRDGVLAALAEVRGSHRVTSQNPEETFQALERFGRAAGRRCNGAHRRHGSSDLAGLLRAHPRDYAGALPRVGACCSSTEGHLHAAEPEVRRALDALFHRAQPAGLAEVDDLYHSLGVDQDVAVVGGVEAGLPLLGLEPGAPQGVTDVSSLIATLQDYPYDRDFYLIVDDRRAQTVDELVRDLAGIVELLAVRA